MRIVSQNRDLSLNFDDIDVFINNTSICTTYNDKQRVLGIYASEERAKEVFDDMHREYVGMPITLNNIDVSEDVSEKYQELRKEGIITATDCPSKVEVISNVIYYMPEE